MHDWICYDKYPGPFITPDFPYVSTFQWLPLVSNGELVGFQLSSDPVAVELI